MLAVVGVFLLLEVSVCGVFQVLLYGRVIFLLNHLLLLLLLGYYYKSILPCLIFDKAL
jgi:hypothetical protein